MATSYEIFRMLIEPFMPVLHPMVRRDLKKITPRPKTLLDVGGRKSPYTFGLDMEITISDIPQETDIQKNLNLGMTDKILKQYSRNRSNIKNIHIEDMTKSTLPSGSYDAAVAVEVIEHVAEDDAFVKQIARVVKDNGWFYLTTPNGDYIKNVPPNYNPDHVKHFTRHQLKDLLEKYFTDVEVWYAVSTGKNRVRGLQSMGLSKPLTTIRAMYSNFINNIESKNVRSRAEKTAHLVALAKNPKR